MQLILIVVILQMVFSGGAWMAQAVKTLTTDFGAGHDLRA